MFEETHGIKKTLSLWFIVIAVLSMMGVLAAEVYWIESVVHRTDKEERINTLRQGFEEQLRAIRKRVQELKKTITPTPFL